MRNRTVWGYAATRILDTPFWGLYNLIPFILYKDLGATPLQIALLVMLKPTSSLLAGYWSSHVKGRPDRLVQNIMWARILGYLPFFLVPFIHTPWYFIALYGLYMMLSVGIVPAWMEILKRNLPKEVREKTFAYTQAFGYLGGGLFPFVIGALLDSYFEAWRWLFPLAALIGMTALWAQRQIPLDAPQAIREPDASLLERIKEPWEESIRLLKTRLDFRQFQLGFMLFGSGLMLLQPSLPAFFIDYLHLSFTELSVALTLCKGCGFLLATPFWTKYLSRLTLLPMTSLMALVACLFPLTLLFASHHLAWLWIAYVLYGFVQAGSELAWNMSGPIFSKEHDSSPYTTVNILSVGVRGTLIPALGALLTSPVALISSALLALGGSLIFNMNRLAVRKLP